MSADDLEPLIFYTLKNEFLNEDIIERTADVIIAVANEKSDSKNARRTNIKKEISDLSFQINNLLRAITTGLDSISAKEMLKDLENRKVALEQTLVAIRDNSAMEIDRDGLIARLRQDTEALMADGGKTKELIHRYITKISISDTAVEVTGISDIDGKLYSGRGI